MDKLKKPSASDARDALIREAEEFIEKERTKAGPADPDHPEPKGGFLLPKGNTEDAKRKKISSGAGPLGENRPRRRPEKKIVAILAAAIVVGAGIYASASTRGLSGDGGSVGDGVADICPAAALSAQAAWQGENGALSGFIIFTNLSENDCRLSGYPKLVLRTDGGQLPVNYSRASEGDSEEILLAPGGRAAVGFQWENWCGQLFSAPISIGVILPEGGEEMDVPVTDSMGVRLSNYPGCVLSHSSSSLTGGKFSFLAIPPEIKIILDDSGKKISMNSGDSFLLKLGEGYNWDISIDSQGVVNKQPGILGMKDAQGVFRAQMPGQAKLEAFGMPLCLQSDSPCAGLPVFFSLDVDVRGGKADAMDEIAILSFATSTEQAAEPAAPEGNKVVTAAQNNRKLTLEVGDEFMLKLGDARTWDVGIGDRDVLDRLPNIVTSNSAQGVYRARKAGRTLLKAKGEPDCPKDGGRCGAPVVFRLNIQVNEPPITADRIISSSDNNGEITVRVGETFLLSLDAGHDWKILAGKSGVIRQEKKAAGAFGVQGLYRALKPGRAALKAMGMPLCGGDRDSCGEKTPVKFKVKIIVQP